MRTKNLLKPLLVAALLTPPPLNPLVGAGLLMAQSDAWVIGDQYAIMQPGTTPTTLVDLPQPLPDGNHDNWKYAGASGTLSSTARTDGASNLMFFAINGNIYDGDGYLIADAANVPGCTECLSPGSAGEFLTVPVPGQCALFYVIRARPRTATLKLSFFVSLLDMAAENPRWPGRFGQLVDLSFSGQNAGQYPLSLMNWFNLNAYDSYSAELADQGSEIKNGYGSVAVMDPNWPGGEMLLHCTTSDRVRQWRVTSGGFTPIGTIWLTASAGNSDKGRLRDTDFGIDQATGQLLFAVSGCEMAAPTGYPSGINYTSMVLRLNATTGALISKTGYQPTSLATVNCATVASSPQGIFGVAFSPAGNQMYFTGDPSSVSLGVINLANGAVTNLATLPNLNIPNPQLKARTHLNLNKAPGGTGTAIYYAHANGLAALVGPDNPATATWTDQVAFSQPLGGTVLLNDPLVAGMAQPYQLDAQIFRDPYLATYNAAACCTFRESFANGTSVHSFAGTTTYTTPWTHAANGLGVTGTNHVYFSHDLTIQANARLFVSNMEWHFAPNARLIVERGAFVQFDNCVLRGSTCVPERWPGVIVRGTYNLPQGQSTYPADQGRMVFRNSTIQDAVTGVDLGKKIYAGGILESTGSTFLNCKVGVDFYPYQNTLYGNPTRNRSRFYNTTFTTDANYLAPLDFSMHAKLWKVDGIPFQGCTFRNLRTTETNSSQLGHGIYALDAHFQVQPRCADPGPPPPPGMCQNVVPTRFTGLDMGIRAATATTTRNFTVDEAEFANNVCGVYANSVLNFEVHNSNFEVGSSKATAYGNMDEYYWQGAHRGIYSYGSYGFLVDDNTLTNNPNATTTQLEGIVTGYSGAHNDVVFRNHASNLEAAFVGEGICAHDVNTSSLGLWYLCNTNANNQNGIFSRRDESPGHGLYEKQTIRLYQGTEFRPADNTFGQVSTQKDIANSNFSTGYTTNPLTYYWALPQVPYWPQYTTAGVSSTNQNTSGNPIVRDPANCESRIDPLVPQLANSGPVDLRAHLMNEAHLRKTAYGNTRYLYDQLIDGGNTELTVQEIQSTWPNEAWELRQSLLDKSPYLSTEVLFEAVEKNIMPPAMVAEICIANPDATKNEGFLRWLQYESPCIMPQYLIDNIIASWETKTYRTTLEGTMAYQHSEMTQALNLTLASYHGDTLVERLDSIRATWSVLRTPAARYAEILTYVQQNNFDSANAVMDRLPVEHDLKEQEINERDRTKQYIGIVQSFRNGERNEAELNEDELNQLRNLRDGYYDLPAEWAQNILCFGYGDCRPPRTGGDGEGAPKSLRVPVAEMAVVDHALSVYPNPAGAWANLVYHLQGDPDNAFIAIRDIAGKEITRIPVEQTEGQAVWDTRAVVPGTYSVDLVNKGVAHSSVKLVVKP